MTMDEQHDDGLGGRGRDRREVTEANRWAGPLCLLTPFELAAAPIPTEIREVVTAFATMESRRAKKRQKGLIDKLVRLLEDHEIAALDSFLTDPLVAAAEAEAWCDRFVDEGDAAINDWLEHHPNADRQQLRTAVRNARDGSEPRRRALRQVLFGQD